MTTQDQNSSIIKALSPYFPEKIGIFGSFARNENRADSDLDILIKLSKPISLLTLVKIEQELSDLLKVKVDLVTEGALKNERLKSYISRDLKMIYQ
jgi:uncharacterized protein